MALNWIVNAPQKFTVMFSFQSLGTESIWESIVVLPHASLPRKPPTRAALPSSRRGCALEFVPRDHAHPGHATRPLVHDAVWSFWAEVPSSLEVETGCFQIDGKDFSSN